MNWQTPISVHERGEVGRVYYINTKLTLPNGEEWTKHAEFTLNPDYGSTIEEMLKRSTEMPNVMKDSLLRRRVCEAKLSSGAILKVWLCDYPAPKYWAPTQIEVMAKKKAEEKPILFDATGNVIQ